MAFPPKKAAAPAPAPVSGAADPTMGAGGDTGSGDDGSDASGSGDDASQGTVLCTVMANADGTYTLIDGDEDDDSDSGDAGDGGGDQDDDSTDDQTTGSSDAGGASDADQGQTFDSPGPLLKGILDLIQAHESVGSGGAEANFQSGFTGTPVGGSSAAPAPHQKY